MLGSSRKNVDHWSVGPRDLPPEPLLLAEPRLRGMEENPIFRMAVYRRKRGASQIRAIQFIPTIFIVFFNMMPRLLSARLKIALLIAFLIGIIWLAATGKKQIKTLDPFRLNIDRGCRIDLLQAGVGSERIVRGHWGSMLGSRRLARERGWLMALYYVSLAAFGVVLLPLGVAAPVGVTTPVAIGFVLPLHFTMGLLRGYSQRPVGRAMYMVHMILRSVRDQKEWGVNWRRALWRFLKRFGVVLLIGFGVALGSALIIAPIARFGFAFRDPIAVYAAVGIAAIAAAVAGPAIGFFIARRVERKTDKYFAIAVENCDFLIELLRREEFERARAGEGK